MPFVTRLIHRASISRPTVTKTVTGQRKPVYAAVTGLASVKCLLVEGDAKRIAQVFGADVQAVAMVYFKHGLDLRPNVASNDGKNDMITVTDEHGRELGDWLVVSTKDPTSARKLLVAAINRVPR